MRERLFSRRSVGTGVPSLAKNLSGGSQNGAGAVPELCLDRVGTVPEPRWNHARTTNLLLEQGHVERTHHAVCSFASLRSRVPAQEREARLVTQLVAALHADDPANGLVSFMCLYHRLSKPRLFDQRIRQRWRGPEGLHNFNFRLI